MKCKKCGSQMMSIGHPGLLEGYVCPKCDSELFKELERIQKQ